MWCYQQAAAAAVRMGLFQMEGYGRINVLNNSCDLMKRKYAIRTE